jgi:hypothetical protein
MPTFELINPCIIGQFKTTYNVENGLEATKSFWNDLTPLITNNLPELIVTFQEGGKLHHYKITEKLEGGSKTANYTINKYNNKIPSKIKSEFLNEVSSVKNKIENMVNVQTGGKKKRYNNDNSSSSSSDSTSTEEGDDYYDFSRYKRLNQPIVYWWYTPSIYRVTRLYTPTFTVPLMPYIHTWVPVL